MQLKVLLLDVTFVNVLQSYKKYFLKKRMYLISIRTLIPNNHIPLELFRIHGLDSIYDTFVESALGPTTGVTTTSFKDVFYYPRFIYNNRITNRLVIYINYTNLLG